MQFKRIILFSVLVLGVNILQAAAARGNNPFESSASSAFKPKVNDFAAKEETVDNTTDIGFLRKAYGKLDRDLKSKEAELARQKDNRKWWFVGGAATVVTLYLGRGQIGRGLVSLGDSLRGEVKKPLASK